MPRCPFSKLALAALPVGLCETPSAPVRERVRQAGKRRHNSYPAAIRPPAASKRRAPPSLAVVLAGLPDLVARMEARHQTTPQVNSLTLPGILLYHARLLRAAASEPRITGLGAWCAFLGAKLGSFRTLATPDMAAVAASIGAHVGALAPRPADDGDVSGAADAEADRLDFAHLSEAVRSFRELREALRQSEGMRSGVVEIGCDALKVATGTVMPPSFDICVRDGDGAVVKRIEVTTVEMPIIAYWGLKRALRHVTAKVIEGEPGRREGAISVTWAAHADRDAVLQALCDVLNARPSTDKLTWRRASDMLDAFTITGNHPRAEEVYATFTKRAGVWSFTAPMPAAQPCEALAS